ncbi:MAG: hypothetical protein QM765_38880 [Myxococcales bacterium]
MARIPWLEVRCHAAASKLGRPDLWEDLGNDALVEALERGEAFLARPAHSSRVGQVRTWLDLCLRHAAKKMLKEARARTVELAEAEEFAATGVATPETAEELEVTLRAVARISTPARRLAFLAFRLPALLEKKDLEAAETWVQREVDEAWDMIQGALARPDLTANETLWRRLVTAVLRTDGPVRIQELEAPRPDARLMTALNTVERAVSRALEEVREALAAACSGPDDDEGGAEG